MLDHGLQEDFHCFAIEHFLGQPEQKDMFKAHEAFKFFDCWLVLYQALQTEHPAAEQFKLAVAFCGV